jgi:hypothetical protein
MARKELEETTEETLVLAEAESDRTVAIQMAKKGAPAAVRRLQQIMFNGADKDASSAATTLLKAAKVLDVPTANNGAVIQIAGSHVDLLVTTLSEMQKYGAT